MVESNVRWYIKCGDWTSEDFNLRIECVNLQRRIDKGTCKCTEPHFIHRKTI